MNDYSEDIGWLKAKVEGHDGHLKSISKDVKAIRSTLDEARGGWKTLLLVGGIAGAIGAFLTKAAGWLQILPK